MVDRPEPFNPLDRVNLGRSVENALLAQPVLLLPPEPFHGAGIYALYYNGDFPAYQPIAFDDFAVPIYVGKAVPPGARQGKVGLDIEPGRKLVGRLRDHKRSIELAENLELEDFRCRFLVTQDIWIPLGESLMIAHFKPVWNRVVEGFGNHKPGGKRVSGARPQWDHLHPGRPWYDEPASPTKATEIEEEIATHFANNPPRRPEDLPSPQEDVVPDADDVSTDGD